MKACTNFLKIIAVGAVIGMAVIAPATVSAQATSAGNKIWLSGELGIISAGFRGEFMLNDKFSLGVNAAFSTLFFGTDTMANVVARLYPAANIFHVGLGLGYGANWALSSFEIVPECGWKIDVGKPGGFFVNPTIQGVFVVGSSEGSTVVTVGGRLACGLGGSF